MKIVKITTGSLGFLVWMALMINAAGESSLSSDENIADIEVEGTLAKHRSLVHRERQAKKPDALDEVAGNNGGGFPIAVPYKDDDGLLEKEDMGKGNGGHGRPPADNEVPKKVLLSVKTHPKDGMTGNIPSRNGDMDLSDLGPDFSRVPVMIFKGLGESSNKPTVIKRQQVNVPLPTFWKESEVQDAGSSGTYPYTLVGETAIVWYGEEVGKGEATALFMANGAGSIVGTVRDGEDTYDIKSEHAEDYDANGNRTSKITYTAFKLKDLPEELEDTADLMTRRLSMSLRAGGGDGSLDGPSRHHGARSEATTTHRDLQGECDDVEGFYGAWYDIDGPFFDCAWYAQGNNCANYGASYSNFGFTAQQACCVCGGGGKTVDVMVVYSSLANASSGGMFNLIQLSIHQTNVALANSGTNIKLRLVFQMPDFFYPDHPGMTNADILDELTTPTDGKLDFPFLLREAAGADLVVYIGENVPSGRASNIGNSSSSPVGFAVVKRSFSALAGKYTFAHEVGHLLNARHDSGNDSTPGFNHGYVDNASCFRTMMSYSSACQCSSCPRILQFSNTKNLYNGKVVGNNSADNGRAITAFSSSAANFMPSQVQSVELCKHGGCEEGSYRASPYVGSWPSMPGAIGNDQLSKVYIPRGLSFEYFQNSNYGGWHRSYGSPDNDMILSMGGHNDAVSSFKVRIIPSGKVKLCKHSDCTGGVYYASVGTWTSMPSEIGNDALTRVFIPKGFQFEYFGDSNLSGWSGKFGSTNNSINLYMGGHNDAVGSFIVSVL